MFYASASGVCILLCLFIIPNAKQIINKVKNKINWNWNREEVFCLWHIYWTKYKFMMTSITSGIAFATGLKIKIHALIIYIYMLSHRARKWNQKQILKKITQTKKTTALK